MSKIHLNHIDRSDFYIPESTYKPESVYYNEALSILPKTWRLKQDSFWTYAIAPKVKRPVQGWKIHISALPESAPRILKIVISACTEKNTEFKFASDRRILYKLLSKNIARQSSGKFITIYPNSMDQCRELLEELYQKLKNEQGPYILSDQQYRDSAVVFYRYGGFLSFTEKDVNGVTTHHIFDKNFELIEDLRMPKFVPPLFVDEIFEGQPTQQSDQETADDESLFNLYIVEAAVQHSNAGGVYIAKDRKTQTKVLLKEARPYIGMDIGGIDAIERLEKEYKILSKLSSFDIAPKPFALFKEWEHTFLAQEFIDGISLRQYLAKFSKITHGQSSQEELNEWVKKAIQISKNIVEAVIILHQNSIIFGDLSLNNIMIDPDNLKIKIIDFEAAWEDGVDKPINMYTPGFAPKSRLNNDCSTLVDDCYAVGCLMLALFAPNITLIQLNPTFVKRFFAELSTDVCIPQEFIDCVKDLLENKNIDLLTIPGRLTNIIHCEKELAKLPDIDVHATFDKIFKYNHFVMDLTQSDRIFPTSAKTTDPLAVDHGITGIIYAWHKIQGSIPADLCQWLLKKYSPNGMLPGLYNGLSGLSWVLFEIGLQSESLNAIEAAAQHRHLFQKMSLGYGAAGYGLSNLCFWHKTGELKFLQEAQKMADIICEAAQRQETGCTWDFESDQSGANIGLAQGASGVALFLLYTYCATGEQRYLQTGEQGLAFDLSTGRLINGALGFPQYSLDSNILYPYLAHGSAGIGTVALRYYLITGNSNYLGTIEKIRPAVVQKYTVAPDLFGGLAGLGHYMLDVYQFLGDNNYLEATKKLIRGLQLFEIHSGPGVTYPYLLSTKVSTDYANGSSGIAMFLHRFCSGRRNNNFMLDELMEEYLKRNCLLK